MAKEKRPFMPFYVREYLADENVQAMTWEQRGIYDHLLFMCWTEGSIPGAAEDLAAILKLPIKKLESLWPRISRCFRPAEEGRLVHAKVETLRAAQRQNSDRKSQNGRLGAEKRWQNYGNTNGGAIETPMAKNSFPIAYLHSQDSSPQPPAEDRLPEALAEAFHRCVEMHPNCTDRDLALQVFLSAWSSGKVTEADATLMESGMRKWLDSAVWAPGQERFSAEWRKFSAWIQGRCWRANPAPSADAIARAKEPEIGRAPAGWKYPDGKPEGQNA